jgi:hypothetical protein
LHGLLTNKNKNSEEKIKFLGFCSFFGENIRRRSVRVLKNLRGFILTNKEILTPTNLLRPPLAHGGRF